MKEKVQMGRNAIILIIFFILLATFTLVWGPGIIDTLVKKEVLYEQETELRSAAIELFSNNEEELPQIMGETKTVSLKLLNYYGYIGHIYDSSNKVCDSSLSYVEIKKTGEDEYEYYPFLFCNKYSTIATLSDWSDWEEVEVASTENDQVETTILYNYVKYSNPNDSWTEWADIQEKNEIQGYEYEYQALYRSQNIEWKWYNDNSVDYASGYYLTAPSGYPSRDSSKTTWGTWKDLNSGSITATSTKQVQYKDKGVIVETDGYYNYETIPNNYPNRVTWDGEEGSWIDKTFASNANGFSYSYDSNKTSGLRIKTRSLSAGEWQTLSSGSVTASDTREIRTRDKKYRYSAYRYSCEVEAWCNSNGGCAHYSPIYDTTPNCDSVLPADDCAYCFYVSGSRISKYGDYDRNEGNTGSKISSTYGRKLWTIDTDGEYYDWESQTGEVGYDLNKLQVQYRDNDSYSGYSDWVTKQSGVFVVNDLQDVSYKEKLYKYYYYDWGFWSNNKTSGTYKVSEEMKLRYKEKLYKYYRNDGVGETEGYYSEAPVGYPEKSSSKNRLSSWSEWNIDEPTTKSYRTIEEKQQTRKRLIKQENVSVEPVLENYVTQAELEELLGKTLEEIKNDPEIDYISKEVTRVRTRDD